MAKTFNELSDIKILPFDFMAVGINPAGASLNASDLDSRFEGLAGFIGNVTVPAAAGATAGVIYQLILPAGPTSGDPKKRCPKGFKCVVESVSMFFPGTGFTGGTDIRVSDSSNTVDFVICAAAGALTGNFHIAPFDSTVTTTAVPVGWTQSAALLSKSGGTFENGLNIRTTGAAYTVGSFQVFVRGYFVKI